MNKNLVDYQPVWSEVEPEVFDSPEDAIEWVLYHLAELHRLIRHHIFHQVKPQEFVDYCNRTRECIHFEILNYLKKLDDDASKKPIVDRVTEAVDNMQEDITRLRRIDG